MRAIAASYVGGVWKQAGIPIFPPSRCLLMSTKAKCLTVLMLLMVLDILPLPIIGAIGLYVVLIRPPWFLATVKRLYSE